MPRLELDSVTQHIDHPRCMTKDHSHSVDAHFWMGVAIWSPEFVHILAANTSTGG